MFEELKNTGWSVIAGLILITVASDGAAQDMVEERVVYDFSSPMLSELLLLGPVDRSLPIKDPVGILRDPAAGKEVVLADGRRFVWKRYRADESGKFRLGQFCEAEASPSDEKIVYGAVTFISSAEDRQVFVGADDGVRVWIDEKLTAERTSPGYLRKREHRIGIPFQDGKEVSALFEFHNYTGSFLGQISSGFLLDVRLLAQDGVSPEPRAPVTITAAGVKTRLRSDLYGRCDLSVPYDYPLQVEFPDGSQRTVEHSELRRVSTRPDVRRLSVSLPRGKVLRSTTPEHPLPPGQYTAVAERDDGVVLLANNGDKSIYCYDGSRCELFPDKKLHGFTKGELDRLVVTPAGAIWMTTYHDGVYCYADGRLIHWGTNQLDEMVQAIFVEEDGKAWVSVSDLDFEDAGRLALLEVGDEPQWVDVSWPKSEIISGILRAQDGQLVLSGANQVVWLNRSREIVKKEVVESEKSQTATVAESDDGSLWLAGFDLFRYRDGSGFQQHGWIAPDEFGRNQQVVVGVDQSLWCFCHSTVYRYSGEDYGVIQRLQLPASNPHHTHICPSGTGTLLVVGESIGFIEIHPDGPQLLTHRDGDIGDDSNFVATFDGWSVVSTEDHFPAVISDGTLHVEPLRSTGRPLRSHRTVVGSRDGQSLLAFFGLASHHRGVRLGTLRLPYCSRVGADGVTIDEWQRVSAFPWEGGSYNAYNFCEELSDGRLVVGSMRGLVELRDGAFEWSDVVKDPTSVFAALHEVAVDDYWLVQAHVDLDSAAGGEMSILHAKGGEEKSYFFRGQDRLRKVNCLGSIDGRVFAGTDSGLFEFSEEEQAFFRFEHPDLRYAQVIMFATSKRQLWAATARDGVFTLGKDGTVVKVDLEIDGNPPHSKSISIGRDNVLWVAAVEGTLRRESSQVAPQLMVDMLANDSVKWPRPDSMQFECDVGDEATILLIGRDDEKSLTFQCRVEGGEWNSIATGKTGERYLIKPQEQSVQRFEFRCVDSDFNYSDIKSVTVVAAYPFWENPQVRWFIGGLLCLLATGVVTLLIVNDRTRSRARDAAEQTTRERELLLARVCHDLRNPLSVVTVATDLLKLPNCDQEKVVGFLTASTSSMTYLTDQLLTYSRSFDDGSEVEREPIDVSAFLAELRVTAILRYAESGIKMIAKIDPDSPLGIVAARLPLAEILNNLIDNSFRYTEAGAVTISYRQCEPETAEFQVSDTGVGMDSETLNTLFEPFVAGQSGLRRASSVGLGMSICQRLVERLGGTLNVASEKGQGTSVTVRLPVEFTSMDDGEGSSTKLRRIVVVDDEPTVRQSIQKLLSGQGHEVRSCSGEDLDETLEEFCPEVLIVDLSMPVRSGFEIASDVRSRLNGEVQIVAMSSSRQLCTRAETNMVFDDAVSKNRLAVSLGELLQK